MALADASRASDWLQQQAAVAAASANSANGNYQPYVQSVLGSFYCKSTLSNVIAMIINTERIFAQVCELLKAMVGIVIGVLPPRCLWR